MDVRRLGLVAALASVAIAFGAPASAKPLPYQTPQQLESKCKKGGGTYGPPSEQGVYTCIGQSGSFVVCGGTGKYAKTCEGDAAPARTAGRELAGRAVEVRSEAAESAQ
jgi:hypothetical protein